ncbi:hypothetical protein AYI96_05260 [Shewanella sp. MSW]|nr:hypothetical protein AYI96_05260 [Shewanella sp. MSW]
MDISFPLTTDRVVEAFSQALIAHSWMKADACHLGPRRHDDVLGSLASRQQNNPRRMPYPIKKHLWAKIEQDTAAGVAQQ